MPLLLFLQAGCFFLSLSLFAPHRAAAIDASPFSFSFDFSEPSSYDSQDLLLEGTAKLGNPVDLSCNSMVGSNSGCTGRVSYNHPMPFYDSTTGEVASFATRFAFAITLKENTGDWGGDGIAFFLSSFPSRMPDASGGGGLGLHNGDEADVSAGEGFVAVEFDTFANDWDPNPGTAYSHIGIDINTVKLSVNTTSLPHDVSMNGNMTASITFDNSTRMLEATLHFDERPSAGTVQVSAQLPHPVTSLLPAEVAVGFSASTGSSIEAHQMMSWSFNSTISPPTNSTVSPPTNYTASPPTNPPTISPPMNSTISPPDPPGHGISMQVIIGTIILVSLFLCWFIGACITYKNQGNSSMKAAKNLAKRYEYCELAKATNKFSEKSRLGEGAFGEVYKGSLTVRDGRHHQVAVKKIKGSSGEDFRAELETISKTSHKNLVSLEGWCSRNRFNLIHFICWRQQKQNVFLVYELVPNGNLHEHLHEGSEVLSWATRYNIVKNIGIALRYLHHECKKCILHRDIKPSNILLDDQFNAKLADFGLSRIAHQKNETPLTTATEKVSSTDPRKNLPSDFSSNEHGAVLTKANGTREYMDPKCMKDGIVSFNNLSDVYSFGIVLLEIACTGSHRTVVWDVYKCNPENIALTADPRLNGDFDVPQMQRVAVLGLWCSLQDDTKRPSMENVMEVLEHDAAMPELTDLSTE